MTRESGAGFNPELQQLSEDDLRNEDTISRILATGSEEERRQFQEFHNISEQDMARYTHFARMRNDAHEAMRAAHEQRTQERLEKSEEEQAMGVYEEQIEPHVRNAVRMLRGKGYDTFGSGFWGPTGAQRIYFHGEPLSGFTLPKEFAADMEKRGISVSVEPDAVSFDVNHEMSMDELENVWDEIAEQLPSR